jgi:uncharacterized protein YdhG (YjbR/CyaY superfamily)
MKNVKKPSGAVAQYYSAQRSPHRETLLEMRRRILEVIPDAQEVMKYKMPTFIYEGQAIAGLLANTHHIGYYPYSGSVINHFPEITEKYVTTLGSIHVPLNKPMLKGEIKKLVKARIASCSIARGEVDLSRYEKLDGQWRELGLPAPARRALVDSRILTVTQLSKWDEMDVARLHGMGPKALGLLKKEMRKRKVSFKTSSSRRA